MSCPSMPFAVAAAVAFSAVGEPLRIVPGVTVRGQEPATWTVDATAPEAVDPRAVGEGLSTRIYGGGDPALHQPLTFRLSPGRTKWFAFRIEAVSSGGAVLEVLLDGDRFSRLRWPAAAATHKPDSTHAVEIPPTAESVALRVPSGVVVVNEYILADSGEQLPAGREVRVVERDDSPERVDGYRGIWFTLGQFYGKGEGDTPYVSRRGVPTFPYGDKYSGGLGTYTAKHRPLAVYAEAVDKTFFVYGGTPAADRRYLLCMIGCFDHKTGMVSRPVVVHDKDGVDDPHDNPAVVLDADGYVWVFVSGRGRHRPGYKYRSRKPYDIESFERVSEEEMTYPQPHYLPGRGFLQLFTKYTGVRELYFESSPDGRTWTEDAMLAGIREPGLSRSGHYQVSLARSDGLVGTFFNRHPDGNVDRRTDVYYAQTADMGKAWTAVDGTPLELPLTEVVNPARAIDYAPQGLNVYVKDMAFDGDGNPVFLYVTSHGHEPGPPNDPREWRLTRWNGTEWITTVICPTDHNYDMGSLVLDGEVWTVFAPTQPGPQAYQGGGEIAVWQSRDRGATWNKVRDVTRNSPANHNYVRRPLNARDPFGFFWADGDPTQLSQSNLYFADFSGEHVWRLPYTMTEPWAKPEPVKP